MSGSVLIAGILAVGGIAAAIASLCYLHLAPTGLSPVRNAVSQYGITAQRAGYRAATISLAVAGLALAVGIGAALHGRSRVAVVTLLAIFAIARAIISWFPMDAPGSPRTFTGAAHGLIALATFGTVTIAAFRLGQILAGDTRWHSLAPASTDLGWAMAACLAAMIAMRRSTGLRRYFGAVERALYLAIIGWLTLFALACTLRVG